MRGILLCVTLLLTVVAGPDAGRAEGSEKVSTLADQQSVAMTIYNDNLALVKDRRRLTLPVGTGTLALREVSAQMQPETALFRSITRPGDVTVLEQNFDFDLLTPAKMLEKYVGREVGVVRSHPTTGEDSEIPALVLSANNGVVLKINNRIETGMPGRLVFADVPPTLRDRPTLVMTLDNSSNAIQEVELSYLTSGLGWQADYVAELDQDESTLNLNGWVTLTNTSGASYNDATLQLVAGDVHRATPEPVGSRLKTMRMEQATAVDMAEEGLLDYHLYTLARPTTIRENQTKQVALLQAGHVGCAKEYRLQGQDYYYRSQHGDLGDQIKVGVYLLFDNTAANNLGQPLPRGVVRVYKADSRGSVQFVGEDRIDHTPTRDTVRLRLGDAFDLTARRLQTDFAKLAGFSRYNYVLESSFRIDLKNSQDKAVEVLIVEPLPGDWEILQESLAHRKASANSAVWTVPVAANGDASLTYRVRVRY